MKRRLLVAAALGLVAPVHLGAQDFGILQDLFRQVNSFTIAVQAGDLMGGSEFAANCGPFGLCGMGTEVFINLHSTENVLLELALGTSYQQGFSSKQETLDFRGAVRSVPTLAVYTTYLRPWRQERVQPFVGASFGLAELWNAQAYDLAGTRYGLGGSTYTQGLLAGLILDISSTAGIFAEAAFRRQHFFSVEWDTPSDAGDRVPAGWPRELNLSSWILSLGWQFYLRSDAGPSAEHRTGPAGSRSR
jgi:hypothetical protein